ncbi:MAG: PDZ domain-containing protein [Thermoproteota archaeon]|nr:PDZ domain-containing protein [Thermoproteota archaeon]
MHPYLGLRGGALTSDLAQNLTGIPAAATHLSGIYVDTITKDGPADKAGLHGSTTDQYSKKHVGDIIIAVDGHKVVRIDDLGSYIDQHKSVGDNITLTIYRNGHVIDLKTTLAARPSPLPFLIARSAPPSPIPHPPPTRP